MLVEVFVKPGCSLCDEALELLDAARQSRPLEVVLRNICESEADFQRYRYEVPVLVIEGVERLRLRFTAAELETALERSRG